jgi:hypothetical protein
VRCWHWLGQCLVGKGGRDCTPRGGSAAGSPRGTSLPPGSPGRLCSWPDRFRERGLAHTQHPFSDRRPRQGRSGGSVSASVSHGVSLSGPRTKQRLPSARGRVTPGADRPRVRGSATLKGRAPGVGLGHFGGVGLGHFGGVGLGHFGGVGLGHFGGVGWLSLGRVEPPLWPLCFEVRRRLVPQFRRQPEGVGNPPLGRRR